MTASLQVTKEISRILRGNCVFTLRGILANDGGEHSDCSTCNAICGGSVNLGIPYTGFTLEKDWSGLMLVWECPKCSGRVTERTSLFDSSRQAKAIVEDSICHKCRTMTR